MKEQEIQKQLDAINECMKELQEAKFHDAPREIIYELQHKIDTLIKDSGREMKDREGFNDKLSKM